MIKSKIKSIYQSTNQSMNREKWPTTNHLDETIKLQNQIMTGNRFLNMKLCRFFTCYVIFCKLYFSFGLLFKKNANSAYFKTIHHKCEFYNLN